jgi:hypothetical protein
MIRENTHRRTSYRLRTLFAVTAGISFVGFVTHWLLSQGIGARVIMIVVPWAIGSFAGIFLAARGNRSTLLGAICGGVIGSLLFPGTMIFYLYLNDMNGVRSLRDTLGAQLVFAVWCSALLAAVVDILRTGLKLQPTRNETEQR